MKKNRLSSPRPLTVALALLLALPATAQQQNVTGALPTQGIGTPAKMDDANRNDTEDTQQNRRAWAISPRIGLSLTATDHANISGYNNRGESDLITEITPGIRIDTQTARLRGYFDYSLRGQIYTQNGGSRHQNSLNSFVTLEAVDNWFFVDVSGNIAQQSISAFGPQSPGDTSINSNSTETATWRVSPYIRGTFGGLADYTLRYNASATRADDSRQASNLDVSQWIAQLRGGTPFHNLQWSLDGNRQTADYANGRKTDADLARILATYLITPQFSISASGGWERNNYAALNDENTTTYGYGFDWNPTPRTQISAFRERRFFGHGHRFSISHRFPMSSIRYSDSRDVSVLPNQFAMGGMGSIYDMYFDYFAAQIPDPLLRAAFVNALLTSSGIDPNRQVVSGFLSSRASNQRRQQLSYVLQGARNSLTLQLQRNEDSAIALALTPGADDFSHSSKIRQKGVSLNFSHRLTPLSNLNIMASRQKSSGNYTGTANLDSRTTLYQISLATKLGKKTTGSLSARHAKYEGNSNSYSENALIATFLYTY
ncbi:MAG: TIGR03016 family PEP-CTERM system-associated outer membrane protein [Betaproteobacteria bacterium]|nr:TIGR03016 family PEP-CTERM system-associated outer membrane protein [Betaproteobacteria bacterium]MCL2885706.1 TIGR03016 family PEP-CTERM system-associated outer membrane protein [Betaproteobacteria bacterium]